MANLNKVMLIGRLGKDPETNYTPSGKFTAKVSIAVNNSWTGADGERHENTEWINLELWEKRAETFAKYLKKGSQVYVEGRLKTEKYEKDGVTNYFTKVVVESFQFLDKKGESDGFVNEPVGSAQTEDAGIPPEDDIPF